MSPQPEQPTPEDHAPQPQPKRRLPLGVRIVGHTLKWILRLVLIVILLVIGAVGWILATEHGTGFAIRQGLDFYNDMIEGEITLEAAEGALISDLVLKGLVAKDAEGRPLAEVDRLELWWSPMGLADEHATVHLLELSGVTVHLRPDGFADVAPAPGEEAPPEPPSEGPPSVPLQARLAFQLNDATVIAYDPDPRTLLSHASLRINAQGVGTEAGVQVDIYGGALDPGPPVGPLQILPGGLLARWDHPELFVDALRLETDQGQITLTGVAFDPRTLTARLDLKARVDAALMTRLSETPFPDDPQLSLHLEGNLKGWRLTGAVVPDDRAQLEIVAEGAVQPAPDLRMDLSLKEIRPGDFGVPTDVQITGGGHIEVSGPEIPLDQLGQLDPLSLTASADIQCEDCNVSPLGVFSTHIKASLEGGSGSADVTADALGAHVEVEAQIASVASVQTSELQAEWRIKAQDITRAARLGGVRVQGSLDTSGRCEGTLADLGCSGAVDVGHFSGFDARLKRAQVKYSVRPMADPIRFSADVDADAARAPGVPGVLWATVHAEGHPQQITAKVKARRRHDGQTDRVSLRARATLGAQTVLNLYTLQAEAMGHEARLMQPTTVTLAPSGRVKLTPLYLAADGARIYLKGSFSQTGRSDLVFDVGLADVTTVIRRLPEPLPVEGSLDVGGHLRGTLARPDLGLMIRGDNLTWERRPVGNLKVDAKYQGRLVELAVDLAAGADRHVALTAKAPLRANLARGDVRWLAERRHDLTWSVEGVSTAWVEDLTGQPLDQTFALTSKGEGHGTLANLQLDGEVRGSYEAPKLGEVPFVVELKNDVDHQHVQAAIEILDGSPLTAVVDTHADLVALSRGSLDPLDIPFEADLNLARLPLTAVEGFLPTSLYNAKGALKVEVDAKGSGRDPQIQGVIDLDEGAISVVPAGVRLEKMELTVAMRDQRVVIEEGTFDVGQRGEGRITGNVSLADGAPKGEMALRIKDLPVLAPGAPKMEIDSWVDVDLSTLASGLPKVAVKVTRTSVLVLGGATRSPKAIPQSKSVVFIDEKAQAAREAAQEESAEAVAEGPALALVVDIPDPIRVYGSFLDMRWGGRVAMGQSVEGAIIAEGGFFEVLGNRFTIETGEITIPPSGELDPFVLIEAYTDTAEARVGVRIEGPASSPSLTLFSEPAMPQYQLLTLLITGSTEPTDTGKSSVESQAASLLASFSNPAIEGKLRDNLGIDRVKLEFGETVQEPILAVGKAITRWLYVETRYHYNAPEDENQTELRGEIRVAPRWTLETTYGDAGVGSLDLFWRTLLGSDGAVGEVGRADPEPSDAKKDEPPPVIKTDGEGAPKEGAPKEGTEERAP